MRFIVGTAAGMVVLLLSLVAGAAWMWHELNTPLPLPASGAVVSVAPAETFRATCDRLQAAGVVRHGWLLRLWAQSQGLDRFVRGGDYRFREPLSPVEVLAALRSPV